MRRVVAVLCVLGAIGCGDPINEFDGTGNSSQEISFTQCQDGLDNDSDGQRDCADPDCAWFVFCVEDDASNVVHPDTDIDSATHTPGDTDSESESGTYADTGTGDDPMGCLEGSYTIANSIDLDLIQPYDCITGSLEIQTGVVNVNLPNLLSVEGDVIIYTAVIQTLDMANLVSVGGNLQIVGAYALTSLTGLEGITSVGGELLIRTCHSLTSLAGLDGISTVGGLLYIDSNHSLESLSGLEKISSVGGIRIEGNAVLQSLTSLEGISAVGGLLQIDANESLTSLTGLDGISVVGGDVFIAGNAALASISGLAGISAVGSGLRIWDNHVLPTCNICSWLLGVTVGGVTSVAVNLQEYGCSTCPCVTCP